MQWTEILTPPPPDPSHPYLTTSFFKTNGSLLQPPYEASTKGSVAPPNAFWDILLPVIDTHVEKHTIVQDLIIPQVQHLQAYLYTCNSSDPQNVSCPTWDIYLVISSLSPVLPEVYIW